MSTLERLYSYAKATGAGALENFTTEALAGAVRENPRPVMSLLTKARLLAGALTDLEVETQVVVPGAGVLDLVLFGVSDGRRHELWCEVKVNAQESGTQLDAYRRHVAAIPAGSRPVLFTLGPRALRDDPTIPFVSWHELRRALTPEDGHAWQDFADFLAEIHMSDDFDQPFAGREAASIGDFRQLHGKVARLLRITADRSSERWPAMPWVRDESTIRKKLLERLASHQQLVVGVQSARSVWLTMGVEAVAGEAALIVTVETWPSANDLQREIIALADAAELDAGWQRSFGAWGGLKRRERLVSLGDADAASEWLVAQIGELASSGVLGRVIGG